jgi:carboxypeptidase family protein/TonB-dependent receptor-like protein
VRTLCASLFFLCVVLLMATAVYGQTTNAAVNGLVVDSSGAIVVGASVQAINDNTNAGYRTITNNEGVYALPNLPPGRYRIQVEKAGFKTLIKPDIVLNVQDARAINFTLQVGATSEAVTVEGGAPLVETQNATVSTVVDRQFAENLPMNGRSFQTLIELTPGVALTTSTSYDSGQFSVNGQRASSNYWTVDGVSANVGIGTNLPGNGLGGANGAVSVLGGTNSLVSVDALQEFRIQTSTYAPEFGRTPGAQISILTRSGTNQFHGTLFEYFRNDSLDASDWFVTHNHLPKPKERQHDFGGTFSGPIIRDRTFLFLSYEGLRLRLPLTRLTTVPDLTARQAAIPAVQPFLNAFPLPNGSDNIATGVAQFNASYSNPASLDAYSIRLDHIMDKLSLFGRYNYSPSSLVQRGGAGLFSLSTLQPINNTVQTATGGVTWIIGSAMVNDMRFNYSRTDASNHYEMDSFGGAAPLTAVPFPSGFGPGNGVFQFRIFSLKGPTVALGQGEKNLQRQFNFVDSLSVEKGSHGVKFGVDFRRLSPLVNPATYAQLAFFKNVSTAESGTLRRSFVGFNLSPTVQFRNLGIYAQDTWHALPRLTMTYGIRWDIDFAPRSNPSFPAVTGFDLSNLSNLALATVGTSAYKTTYGNFAPRFGVSYELTRSTVVRGGAGLFYDLATQEVGNLIDQGAYPYSATNAVFGSFPMSPATAAPPSITPPNAANQGSLTAFNPRLQLPYTLHWNFAVEQAFGKDQSVSASYIGAAGRRLIQTALVISPTPNIGFATLVMNAGTSDYNALQLKYQRRLSHGLQVLASYAWSHSIDTASAGSSFSASNFAVPGIDPRLNRGPSDFDIRHAGSAGIIYDVQVPKINAFANAILHGWSFETFLIAHSAAPVDVSDINFFAFNNGSAADVRPDVVPGQPFYLFGAQCVVLYGSCPGGRGFNPAAFADPPADPNTGRPLRQGTLGRNALRGFGAFQWDFAVHRDFPLRESLKLQFRLEVFNILNHTNLGPPGGLFLSAGNGGPCCGFGVASQTLGQYLSSGNVGGGGGGLSSLYQIGGPRSTQLALKLVF